MGLGELAQAGTVDQATAFGEVVFLAVPYGALPQIGRDLGSALKDKIVLDACNAVATPEGSAIADEVERDGIGAVSQKYLPGTRLVRAFNTLNYMIFAREANRPDPKLAKAGNARVRRGMIQLAWRFLRVQKDSALTQWYRTRTESAGEKRKTMIVALARKLLIALWRVVTIGEVPAGVVLLADHTMIIAARYSATRLSQNGRWRCQ